MGPVVEADHAFGDARGNPRLGIALRVRDGEAVVGMTDLAAQRDIAEDVGHHAADRTPAAVLRVDLHRAIGLWCGEED